MALCTINVGCACEEPIVAGCYVDTFRWDVFQENECMGFGGTYGDYEGNRTATFSVGTHATPNPYGFPSENMRFGDPQRYTVKWSGGCIGNHSMCGGIAEGSRGGRELNATVEVYDKYLDKNHSFDVRAQVNTVVCGYFGHPACTDATLEP